jgi:hypothetical protein
MIYSLKLTINVLTNYASTKGIVEQTYLDISSTNQVNRRLITTLVYLSEYDIKVFYFPSRLNFVPNILS